MPTGPEIEQSVYEWWSGSLKRFLQERPDEVYTGLAAVCNPFDPGFFLCLGTEQDRGEPPEEWRYESFDYDRTTRDGFNAHFAWLYGFGRELGASDKPRRRDLFETFIEALMRAMIRVERESVEDSPRFSTPADVFVFYEDDELDRARERYRTLKEGQIVPGWSKAIAGMKG